MNEARTRSVAVLGGGIVAAAAAIAFRRALPEAGVTVFADGREPDYIGAADPFIERFHAMVGIDPALFERRTGAVTVNEAEFRLAGKPAFRFVRFDAMAYVEGVALHQLWLRHSAGDPASAPPWSEVARRARRPDDLSGGLGVRFDAAAYLALLVELAEQSGIKSAGAASVAELAPRFDLVVDTLGAAREDWLGIAGLPGGLVWELGAGSGEPGLETVAIDQAGARWATAAWQAAGRIDPAAGSAGRARDPFDGHVLAAGRAALRCETFDGRPLSVALTGITRAIELLPRPGASGREAAEYNRRMGMVHDFLLDWAIERWGNTGPVPPTLAALRAQYARRGRIPFRDEDPVSSGQWLGWLLGSGQRPDDIDLAAMALSDRQVAEVFAAFTR